jgi:putative Ca2+/H+ antiporter (TMEM165/GDT1 family)
VSDSTQRRSLRIAGWFLAISYGIGAPVTAIAELRSAALSERFGLPPELIYLTCAVQLASASAVLVRALAPWAALALTAVTVGAIGAHLNTEAPVRAIPAVLYTVLQIWFGIENRSPRSTSPAA